MTQTTSKVLLFGTHPKQFNGYSKVVYELIKCMANEKSIETGVYGFQKFYENAMHRRDIPANVTIYDAFENENPRQMGFGINQTREFVKQYKPDVCIVYNDMLVLHQIITQLRLAIKEDGMKFKIIAYIDQVYLNQKKEFIDFINANCDYALMFTDYWEKNILDQGIKLPSGYLAHGFNKMTYFPIPKHLARQYYGLKQEDFIILNLNRNQPRKRWDICLKMFAELVSRYPNEPIKLMIATALQGGWNLIEIFERELKKRNMTLEDGMKHLIIIDNPQRVTDEETNILYNVADIGVNTCDGEGFGLCNFEQGGIGIPQVVPRLGGFIDYFDDDNAMLIDPKIAYYADNTRDMVGGEALLCDYSDFVEAIESYYFNKDLRAAHGKKARAKIVHDYGWEGITNKLIKIVKEVCGVKEEPVVAPQATIQQEVEDMKQEIEKIDISTLQKLLPDEGVPATDAFKSTEKETVGKEKRKKIPVVEESDTSSEEDDSSSSEEEIVAPKKKAKKDKKLSAKKQEILKLKKKLEKLLKEDDDSDDS